MTYDNSTALEIARELQRNTADHNDVIPALINALLRIDTLERQVQTLSKDLAKVALSKRKYISDGNSNKDQS